MREPRIGRAAGKVRAARLTDLPALGELSRLCQSDSPDTRSLGLPVSGPRIGMFSLFRLPLGAFRPNDLLFVYDNQRRLAGLVRVEREASRDEWTVVELDAIGHQDAGDIRFRLVQHLLRDGSKRGAQRFHVACADAVGNVELFMQAGFVRYGDETLWFRAPGRALPAPWGEGQATASGIRLAAPTDAVALMRLYSAVTPTPVQRLEAYRLSDWERHGISLRLPRSSLAPILRFADVETFVQAAPGGGKDGTELAALVQLGLAKEDQPHYLKIMARPEVDTAPLMDFGLGVIAAATDRRDHGVLTPIRTYEGPTPGCMEEAGFEAIATVTLLLKETLVRVAEPALAPVGVR